MSSPDLTGDKTIQIRQAATGTKLASEKSDMYTFTADNWPNTRKYIPIEHLSIHSYSTQSTDSKRPYYAPNAIDGNIHTMWHTDFGQNVLQQQTKPFIAIELDEPRNISAIEFVQGKWRDADPVYIKNAIIYVSNDGETWIEAGRKENCEQDLEFKSVELNESVYGKYVKIEMDTYGMFSSIAMVNLFEDKSKVTLANFSFNGENAGKIVLSNKFDGNVVRWDYSLDGKNSWNEVSSTAEEHKYSLTDNEIASITAENDIYIHIVGTNYSDENVYKIDIEESAGLPTTLYANDLENRMIGIDLNTQWRYTENDFI